MKNIKALIVEDEILIAETIKLFLEERGHAVVGIAISYEEAIELLSKTNPDIVLLDIRLYGEKSGIDLARYLLASEKKVPYIIVSSQYESKIIEEAMYAGASGYLTKPISKESLWSTIELSVLKQEDETAQETFIDLKMGYESQRIRLSDIIYIKSDHVYVEVVCAASKYFCRYTLKEILAKIKQPYFLQCHRSFIVNTKKVEKYSSSKIWINGEVLPISSKYKSSFLDMLKTKGVNT